MAEKLVLIDGNSIVNRAFYGLPPMTNSEGFHTNAIYGFINILLRIMGEENGDYLCIAFDLKAPTFRHKMYDAYKGTRKPMPEELREQIPVLKELLAAMGVYMLSKEGYEADDILGTLAKRGEADGLDVTLVSGDRDLLQIATDRILVRIPKTKAGKTEIENYHTEDVIRTFGLKPLQIIELKALMGDASDNIPGVPKIGEKTATELLLTYHDIDNLHDHISEISKNSVRQTLTDHFDMAVLSKTLATIDIHADIPIDYEAMRNPVFFTQDAYVMMKNLGFKNFLTKFQDVDKNVNHEVNVKRIDDFSEALSYIASLSGYDEVGFYIAANTEGIGKEKVSDVLGAAFSVKEDEAVYIPVAGFMTAQVLTDAIGDVINHSDSTLFSTFALKDVLFALDKLSDYEAFEKKLWDLKVGAYLHNPLKNDYSVEDVSNEYAGHIMQSFTERFGKMTFAQAAFSMNEDLIKYICECACVCKQSVSKQRMTLSDDGMLSLFSDVEMPLILCLYHMEREGIAILEDELIEYGHKLGEELVVYEKKIYEEAGEQFNIQSPKQLGEILFGKLNLPGGKKTKTGYSTSADVLEKLAPDYPIVKDVLSYRAIAKLKSTYAEGLIPYIASDGRIHSTFHQTITATGRISSADPNLQNIPVRMEQGRLIRKVFVPRPGCVFVDADYSQIELRILAHMSGDEKLIASFNNNEDIHRMTASKVFNVPFEEVTPLQRRSAKAVNFGIIYGISAFGLGEDLNISRKEANAYIEQYFEMFPRIKAFLESLVSDAKEKGVAVTIFGRKRPVPELSASDFIRRSFGERVAMNAPIQGSAADIMKIAMINTDKRLYKEGLKSRLILQVHDELMIETYKEEEEQVKTILKEEMEGAATLAVVILSEVSVGNTWYEAK